MAVSGYNAVQLLSKERPDLLPLVTVMLEVQNLMRDHGVEWFNDGVDELLKRGIVQVAWLSP